VVPDTFRHTGATVISAVPDVVVLSVYVPSDLALQVPLTFSDAETVMVVQPIPSPDASISPLTSRHDDATLQVPTTSPPQGDTSMQDPPPLLPLPGFSDSVTLLPPAPPGLSERRLHAAIIPNAIVRTADWVFI